MNISLYVKTKILTQPYNFTQNINNYNYDKRMEQLFALTMHSGYLQIHTTFQH